MDRYSQFFCFGIIRRLQLPALAVAMLLQRSPVLKILAEKQFSHAPMLVHLLKWVSGAGVLVGSVNTVTGATTSVQLLNGYDNTRGTLGEYFRLSFASTDRIVGSYKLGAAPPPGLTLNPVVNEYGVGTIDGIPTRAGVYNMDIYAYEEKNHKGDLTLLALTVYIDQKGPDFNDHPNSVSLGWGAQLNLSAGLRNTEGANFQWVKDGEELIGETNLSYSVQAATSMDEGSYVLRATKDGIALDSNSAMVTITVSAFQAWKETAFTDPFSAITDEVNDPDMDGFNNLMEYAMGTDPMLANRIPVPAVSTEKTIWDNYVVYSVSKNINASGVSMIAEYSESMLNPDWATVFNGTSGMLLEETGNLFKVKVPRDYQVFIRFRVSDG